MKRKKVFEEAGMVQTGRKIKGFPSIISWKIFTRPMSIFSTKLFTSSTTEDRLFSDVEENRLFIDTEKALLPATLSHVGLLMEPDDQIKVPRNKILKLFREA
jgi:hypothetical protein